MAHEAFEVSDASAAAELFLGVERDDGMSAFEGAGRIGIAAEADAVAERPDADDFVELVAGGGEAGGGGVGIVEE